MKEIIRRRSNGEDSTDVRTPLFSEKIFNANAQKQFADLCKKASVELDWPAGQHFHGTHMFRHGAIADAFAEGGTLLAKLRGGHESDKCMKLYAQTDAERDQRLQLQHQENKKKSLENAALKVLRDAEDRARALAESRDINTEIFRPQVQEDTRVELAWKQEREKYVSSLDLINQINSKLRSEDAAPTESFLQDWNYAKLENTSNASDNNRHLQNAGRNDSPNNERKEMMQYFKTQLEGIINNNKQQKQNISAPREVKDNNKIINQQVKLSTEESVRYHRGEDVTSILIGRGLIKDKGVWRRRTNQDCEAHRRNVVEKNYQWLIEEGGGI